VVPWPQDSVNSAKLDANAWHLSQCIGGRRRGHRGISRATIRSLRHDLSGLLGEVEVAEEAAQGGEDTAPLVAEGPSSEVTAP
jgi:hypothetical protein